MLKLQYAARYRRDLRRLRESGKDLGKLQPLITLLRQGGVLPPCYKDHQLTGDLWQFRDAHVDEPDDWVLVYRISGGVLHLARTGEHAHVFRASGSPWHRRQKPR